MLLQASINTYKKRFAEYAEILKSFIRTGISLNKGTKRLEEGTHRHIFILLKNGKNFHQSVTH